MSIYSMTGFGRGEASNDKYSLVTEIKSVNHRFKDIRLRCGSIFNEYEIELRKKIENGFKRGSFDININYKRNSGFEKAFNIDETKIKAYVEKVRAIVGDLTVTPTEFLRPDFYIEENDDEKKLELKALLESSISEAIDKILLSRKEEGEKLTTTIRQHIDTYKIQFSVILDNKDSYKKSLENKIREKFSENKDKIQLEDNRFAQEIIYYLEKLDVDEEVNRIQIHLSKLDKLIEAGGEVGRKIDFILQELNRETNTIGSKSGSTIISDAVVEMKVQLEKIREQALNVE